MHYSVKDGQTTDLSAPGKKIGRSAAGSCADDLLTGVLHGGTVPWCGNQLSSFSFDGGTADRAVSGILIVPAATRAPVFPGPLHRSPLMYRQHRYFQVNCDVLDRKIVGYDRPAEFGRESEEIDIGLRKYGKIAAQAGSFPDVYDSQGIWRPDLHALVGEEVEAAFRGKVFQFSLNRWCCERSGPDRERREKNRGIEDIVHRSIHSWFPVAVTLCLLHTGFRRWRRKRRCPENNW